MRNYLFYIELAKENSPVFKVDYPPYDRLWLVAVPNHQGIYDIFKRGFLSIRKREFTTTGHFQLILLTK